MNILFLATRSPFPLISGLSMRTYHILRGVAQRHKVTLLTFVQLPEHELKRENLDHLSSFCRAVHPFRIPVDGSKWKLGMGLLGNLFSPLPFVAQKYDSLPLRQKIREILSSDKIDLVHVDLLPLSVYINEIRHIPKVLVNHNVESLRLYRWLEAEKKGYRKSYLRLQHKKLRSFERRALEAFDCCVVVSEVDRQLLAEMGVKNTLMVVPNGTDTEFFKPKGGKRRPNRVLWIGHMDVHTNRDAVLHFWREMHPLLRKQYPLVEMTFVGTAPPEEIAHTAQRDARVRVTGFVDDIRPYLDEAAVVVVPIRIGSGTRIKILDAMAMGKAIVSTTIGAEGLDVRHGENILIADAPADFVQATVSLIKDEGKREEIERNARRTALEYDWKKLVEIQEQAYETALRRKGYKTM